MRLVKVPNGWLCPDDPGEPQGGKRWSINSVEARVLSELFRNLRVLEIGTGLGVSTKGIAKTALEVHTVDIDEWVEKTVAPELPENCKFYRDVTRVPRPLDAAFIDGLHTKEQCSKDIVITRKIVKKGGIIVFHDTHIQDVYDAIAESEMYGVEIKTFAGMAMVWND